MLDALVPLILLYLSVRGLLFVAFLASAATTAIWRCALRLILPKPRPDCPPSVLPAPAGPMRVPLTARERYRRWDALQASGFVLRGQP